MSKPLTKRQAEILHREIRDGLLNIEKKIAEFAQRQGHLALGYKTFADYWSDRMSAVALRTPEALNIVQCVMLDEGLAPEEISRTLLGVSSATARKVKAQRDLGIRPEKIRVREHDRKAERAPESTVHVKLPPATYRKYKTIARRIGSTLEREAEMALRLHFAELAVRSERDVA